MSDVGVPSRPTRLRQLVLEVPDPATTGRFLEEGLTLGTAARADGAVTVLTDPPYAGTGPAEILVLRAGPGVRLVEVVLEGSPGLDLGAVTGRLEALGRTTARLPADDGAGPGLAVEVGGIRVSLREIVPAVAHQPVLPPSSLRPRRLGHVNVLTPEPAALVQTMIEGLGLRLSEQIGEAFYFLRIGSEHHNLGVRAGPVGGAHHVALEVHGWDSYRVLCDRLAGLGWSVEYGPGRHGPGNNLFVYVRDPSSGLRFELFSDMVHIEDEATYRPPRWRLDERHRTVNVWGPGPPESFLS
ncbi:VOC family protein [Geodermatophilus sp. DSM 44513]|uniref:VOC family protein n=1 Tax=Geodermatophilus sp. DSM 44513 TaxID=1528104 RepID=UPI00127C2147|nr:VOC family protein [Geodermatophilus sp. DSM 44513]WNV77088.1 VOC family protein [Geodermatophilus sp. DSM 44513]